MRLVAARSLDAQARALAALRAIEVDSPMVAHRVARVAEQALADPAAEWSPEERQALAEACGRAPADEPSRAALSALLADSGLSAVELARVLGRDERAMRRWLAGEQAVPDSLARQVDRIERIEVTPTRVRVVVRR